MSKKIGALAVLAVSAFLFAPAGGSALAANFEPGPGLYTVNTTALTLTGPGTSINGTDQAGVAVFSFDAVSIPANVEIEVEGSRPLRLVASGELALGGLIEASGFGASNFAAGPFAGGPGAAGGGDGAVNGPGLGLGGGGVATNVSSGGGGGGFGGSGARGGNSGGGFGGPGGLSYGNLEAALAGGSGGSAATGAGGGGGGGAVALEASTVRIVPAGEVAVDGGDGAVGGSSGSGGGSGGGILIRANTLQLDGLLSAAGGVGGVGGCCGGGGGGGGGRVALQYKSLSLTGTIDVSGGTSNVGDAGPCGCGAGIPGDPAGLPGVVTKTLIPDPPSVVAPKPSAPLPLTAPQKQCVVPKVRGMKVPVAKEALRRAGCSAGKIERVYSLKVEKGRVIGATAKSGKALAAGAKVGLKVSKGERPPRGR